MDLVKVQDYPTKLMSNINTCQLYLHALTMSNITCVIGTHLEISYFTYKQATTIPTNNQLAYKVSKSNKLIWHYWQKFLKKLTTHKSKRLRISLGEWTAPISQVWRQYTNYRTENKIFTKNSHEIIQQNMNNNHITKKIA
jgi:hypothetical protein